MMRNKTIPLFTAAIVFTFALLILPAVFRTGAPASICDRDAAAQENPCAAQDATIAAYGLLAAQATLDTAYHRQTVTALEARCAVEPTPVEGLPFRDDFSDNAAGWRLTETQYTAVNVADGQLFIGAGEFWFMSALVPELQIRDFYIEATVTTPYEESIFVGFVVGDAEADPNQLHLIVVGSDWDPAAEEFVWYVRLYEWNGVTLNLVAGAPYQPFWQAGTAARVALEAKGGRYTLSINGYETQQFEFTAYGDELGLVVYAPDNMLNDVRYAFFDDLTIDQGN